LRPLVEAARAAYDRGAGAEQSKRLFVAVQGFREALASLPDFRDAAPRAQKLDDTLRDIPGIYQRALAKHRAGKWDEALTLFAEVHDTTLGYEDADRYHSDLSYKASEADREYREAQEAESKRQWERAIRHYKASEGAFPRYRDIPERVALCQQR